MIVVPWVTQAQMLSDYTFSTGVDTTRWITLDSATNVWTSYCDDVASGVFNLGFNFPFGEGVYNRFAVSSNGIFSLGSDGASSGTTAGQFTSSYYTTSLPKICGIARDMSTGSNGYVHYQMTGTAPNRVFVCEFAYGSSYNADVKWQVQLHEDSSKVVIVYGHTAPVTTPSSFQTGLAEVSNDIIILNPTTHQPIYCTTYHGTTYSTWHGAGRYYEFVRPVITCPRVNRLNVNATVASAYLSWNYSAALDFPPDNYEISYRYTADTGATPTTILTSDLNYVLTGLDPDTDYTVTVTPLCGSDDYGMSMTRSFSTRSLPCLEWDTTGSGPVDSTAVGTDGTSGTYYMPVNQEYNYSYCQHLIRTSEITLTGPSMISAVGFQYMYSQPLTQITNCSIYMAHTTLTALTSGSFIPYDSLQLVYVGPLDCATSGWNYFQFNQGNFPWDGTRNMVIGIVNNSGAHATTSHVFGYHIPTSGSSLRTNNNTTPYGPTNMASSTTTSTWRTNMRLLSGGGECIQIASCSSPYVWTDSLTSNEVYLSWIPGYQENMWDIDYRAEGDTLWTNAAMAVTTTSYTLSSLTQNTLYEIRITALCSDTDMATTVNVRTQCSAESLPFTENFETWPTGSGAATPSCWYRASTYSSGYPYISTSYSHNGGGRAMYMYSSSSSYSYFTLPVMAAAVDSLQVSFWLYSTYSGYSHAIEVGVMEDPADMSTFTAVDIVQPSSTYEWEPFEVPLNTYTGTGQYIIFWRDIGISISI